MGSFSDERVRSILLGVKAYRTILFPGTKEIEGKPIEIAVRALSERELDDCRIAAQRQARDSAKSKGWEIVEFQDVDPSIMQRFIERQIVWRAFANSETLDREKPEPFFPSYNDVAELDSVTLTNLMSAYLEHQEWANPSRRLSNEQVEELVETLGKERAPVAALSALEPNTLLRFAISTASRLREMRANGK